MFRFGSLLIFSVLILNVEGRSISKMASKDPAQVNHADKPSILPWWKTSVLYQIYPRSFQDSDGDGIGDLQGIISRMDYLKSLGIGAVWLSPIYVSPMADFGYDVANYIDIDPVFGSLQDFDQLLSFLKSSGIKLIMDFVPNHTSDEHEWFQKSVKKIAPYTDYYVWQDPKELNETGQPVPPNNWLSIYGSAWEWNEQRQQFYFHQYERKQPDLNVRNPAVMQELEDVIKFWFDRGVAGLRIDALQRLFEVEDVTLDEPVNEDTVDTANPNHRDYLKHLYTMNQPETLEALGRWRQIADSYNDRMLMVQVFDEDISQVMKFYGTIREPLAHFPLNYYLLDGMPNRTVATGENIKRIIDRWLDNMPEGAWPNWVFGSHDNERVSTRLGTDFVDAINMLLLLAEGTPTTYYGEEIGMEDTFVSFEDAQDLRGINFGPDKYEEYGRDPSRSPFQWEPSKNAGFSTANKTWLPVNKNYQTINVATELDASQSHLKVYKELVELRKQKTFTHGHFDYLMATTNIFGFVRHLKEEIAYLLVINTSNDTISSLDLIQDSEYQPLPAEGAIIIRSSFDTRTETKPGATVSLDSLTLLPSEGFVIRI